MTILALHELAIVVSQADNVAVAKRELEPGMRVGLTDERVVELRGAVTPGNRFATRAIPEGEHVLQYGHPIGTSLGIELGDPITKENMSDEVPVVRDLPDDLQPGVYTLSVRAVDEFGRTHHAHSILEITGR